MSENTFAFVVGVFMGAVGLAALEFFGLLIWTIRYAWKKTKVMQSETRAAVEREMEKLHARAGAGRVP